MMRAGISRVVVEIIILVIAVALALLIFSPISGYIFGSLGRTATVGGASQIQILNANLSSGNNYWIIDVKNLGPGTPTFSSSPKDDFKVFVDGSECTISNDVIGASANQPWTRDFTVTLECSSSITDRTKQHNIVVYGPGGTQAQYLYYPPPS
ncbi:hypothetical protein D6D85_09645 [Candidatus Methanodesulfokora washburnensis]|uniref:Type IV pilin n=2 Tax=Candidatus Methanodesulfokora washburnensis TaxID=2478471 RepID=A0A3R9PUU5_9CREN|nr:hypothetical protein D6D85_09645 [Candidatus Methanodesulfokores washburnensis]